MRKRLCFILFALSVAFVAMAQNDTVVFSATGGFYDEVFPIELRCLNPNNHIRYTTNGNRPTSQSPLYSGSLTLDERLYSKSNIYTLRNCPEDMYSVPESIERCIVIRAAVFNAADSCVSTIYTNSYFIKSLGCNLHGLPAVSLCVDSLDLFDYYKGIFVEGACYNPEVPHWSGNYYQHGKRWERPSNFEFYELDNTGVNQQCGVRTHGGNGRRFQQKTLKVYARDEYGKKRFKHQFFKNIPERKFKTLVLRPFHSNNAGIEDHISNLLAQQMGVDFMADRPSVMFINGEYWGIYYIKEKPDEHYVEDHYGIDARDVNLYWRWMGEVENGSPENFMAFLEWLKTADLADEEQYAYAEARLDIDEFINYYILEMFIANFDWPANNVRFWQTGDSKFRWLFYDGDSSLENQEFDVYANAVYEGDDTYPSNRESTLLFRKLLGSPQFQKQFAARFNQLLSTTLSYKYTYELYQNIKEAIEEEAHLQFERFAPPENFYAKNYADWMVGQMDFTRNFLEQRPTYNFLSMKQPTILAVEWQQSQNRSVLLVKAEEFGSEEINLYDNKGKKVFSQACVLAAGHNTINLNLNLDMGVYYLRIGKQNKRIIVY